MTAMCTQPYGCPGVQWLRESWLGPKGSQVHACSSFWWDWVLELSTRTMKPMRASCHDGSFARWLGINCRFLWSGLSSTGTFVLAS